MHVRRITSAVAALAGAAALSGVAASPASAAPPHRYPAPSPGEFTVTGACSFDVHIVAVASKEYVVKTTVGSDGSISVRVTGSLKVTATNTSTGKSALLNVSGPSTSIFAPDNSYTIVGQGQTLTILNGQPPGSSIPNGIFVTTGKVVFAADSQGNTTTFAPQGTTTNVCSLLS